MRNERALPVYISQRPSVFTVLINRIRCCIQDAFIQLLQATEFGTTSVSFRWLASSRLAPISAATSACIIIFTNTLVLLSIYLFLVIAFSEYYVPLPLPFCVENILYVSLPGGVFQLVTTGWILTSVCARVHLIKHSCYHCCMSISINYMHFCFTTLALIH